MSGTPYKSRDGGYPPYDTGILGKTPGPTDTTVVVGFGHTLYDNRFGLGRDMLTELEPMVKFTDDYLVMHEHSNSGISLTIEAHSGDAAIHALRRVRRETRGKFVPRWPQHGFNHIVPAVAPGETSVGNLLGFKDGTANLDGSDINAMEANVGVGANSGRPDWAAQLELVVPVLVAQPRGRLHRHTWSPRW